MQNQKYYIQRCSIPKLALPFYLKNCSTKQFINRFHALPIYNAIHSNNKFTTSCSRIIKRQHYINEQKKQKLYTLLKISTPEKKMKYSNENKNSQKFRTSHKMKSEHQKLESNKKNNLEFQKSLDKKYSNLLPSSNQKSTKWICQISNTQQPSKISKLSQIKKQRLSLKVNPTSSNLFAHSSKNNKVLKELVQIQKSYQRKTYCPFDDDILQKQDLAIQKQQRISIFPNSRPISSSKENNQSLSNQSSSKQPNTQTLRVSIQVIQKQITKSNKNMKDKIPILKFNSQNLERCSLQIKNNKKHKQKANGNQQNKQNIDSNIRMKKKQRQSFINNVIKTTDDGMRASFKEKNNSNERNQSIVTEVFSNNKSSKPEDYELIYNQSEVTPKSLTQNVDLISILHPDGQFSKDFNTQFNPW